jgi:hypothetical protein
MRRMSLILLLLFPVLPAHGGPTIEVRARTEIALEAVERTQNGARISGRVFEPATGLGVPDATVELDVSGVKILVDANDAGEFSRVLPLESGGHALRVKFAGGQKYQAATTDELDIDVERQPLEATVVVINDSAETDVDLELAIATVSSGRPVSVPIEVSIQSVDGSIRATKTQTTDAQGLATVAFDKATLGGAGQKKISARFLGSDAYDAAQKTIAWTLVAKTRLTAAGPDTIAQHKTALLRGELKDAFGAAVELAPIRVARGEQTLGRAVTDAQGTYTVELPASALDLGRFELAIEYTSDRPWLESTMTTHVLTVNEQAAVPARFIFLALGATAVFVFIFHMARRQPLKNVEPPKAPVKARGLDPGKTGFASALGRAGEFGFSGRVENSRGEPLFRAHLIVRSQDGDTVTQKTGSRGDFVFAALPAGSHLVSVEAPRHVTETFPIQIPHRGRLTEVTVTLLEVREFVFERYEKAVTPFLPRSRKIGIWTPRELLLYVRRLGPAATLSALTDLVESVYFSEKEIVPDPIAAADALISALEREQAAKMV